MIWENGKTYSREGEKEEQWKLIFVFCFFVQQHSINNQLKNKVNTETQTDDLFTTYIPYRERYVKTEDEDFLNGNVSFERKVKIARSG